MAEKTKDDILFQEIDEELRQDRAHQLWQAYGKYAIAAVVVIIAAVGGYQSWRNYDLSTRRAAGERFHAAMGLAATNKNDAAFKAFADIAADGSKGYQLLARFSQARILAQNGKSLDASLAYRVLADDVSVDSLYRGLATILGAYQDLNSPGADFAALKQRLQPLMAKTDPWRFSAQEITGLLSMRSGDKTKARELFSALDKDRDTPQGVRTRAQEMLSILGK
ncbi:MAG: tetratricopeptide repeat protein [Proteobacteria bacterium]|nr:tetratricopeptide repeat protein [Pseudomonadota bacterium]